MVKDEPFLDISQYISEIPNDTNRKTRKARKEKTGRKHTRKATSPFPIHPVQTLFLPDRSHRNQMPVPIPQSANSKRFSSTLSVKTVIPDSTRQIPHWMPPKTKRVATSTCRSRKSDRINTNKGHNKNISIAVSLW